jgi:hypothetical protein
MGESVYISSLYRSYKRMKMKSMSTYSISLDRELVLIQFALAGDSVYYLISMTRKQQTLTRARETNPKSIVHMGVSYRVALLAENSFALDAHPFQRHSPIPMPELIE